jgi:hypothetical protein
MAVHWSANSNCLTCDIILNHKLLIDEGEVEWGWIGGESASNRGRLRTYSIASQVIIDYKRHILLNRLRIGGWKSEPIWSHIRKEENF